MFSVGDWLCLEGDVDEVADELLEERGGSYHAIFGDPPYGIDFMGRDWDRGVPGRATWERMYRLLVPGGALLQFGGRYYHRLATAIEAAGFEIHNPIGWLYGEGMPRGRRINLDLEGELADQWEGYHTGLRPSLELVCVAFKPPVGTYSENAVENGVGGYNIDGCRMPTDEDLARQRAKNPVERTVYGAYASDSGGGEVVDGHELGRWPANVILDPPTGALLDHKTGRNVSRFFYCPKPSLDERERGLEAFEPEKVNDGREATADNGFQRGETERRNIHPTVKPIALTQYLAKLVLPPRASKPRRLLVPFSGVGSEMIGGILAGWDHVDGIEREHKYIVRARARLTEWTTPRGTLFEYANQKRSD